MPSPLQGQTNEQHARPDLAFRLPLGHCRTRGRPLAALLSAPRVDSADPRYRGRTIVRGLGRDAPISR